MRTWNICAAAIIGLALGATAFGEVSEAEKNKRAEEEARFDAYFKERDTNGDGKLSAEESATGLEGRRAEMAKRFFGASDADKDGYVTLVEFKEFRTKMRKAMEEAEAKFNQADTNADMKVSLAEATANKTPEEVTQVTAIFAKVDADKDGFATKDELRRAVFESLSGQP